MLLAFFIQICENTREKGKDTPKKGSKRSKKPSWRTSTKLPQGGHCRPSVMKNWLVLTEAISG